MVPHGGLKGPHYGKIVGISKEIRFQGELRWDASKPDGTLKKLTDVTKLHQLGWHHKIEIDEGIHRLYQWYKQGICINHQTV